jgi:ergothioneine biosynthesis protein EgtB
MEEIADLSATKALLERFQLVRRRTIDICAPLQMEDYVPQPSEFVSPPKWHLGHSTWFFEQFVLSPFCPDYKLFSADFAYVFNSYYNAIGDRVLRADRGNLTRPGVREVLEYRAYVDQQLTNFLLTEQPQNVLDTLELGLNHEEQHQELLWTDLKYILGNNPLFPTYKEGFSLVEDHNSTSGWLSIDEGLHHIGHSGEGFCYDNELGQHKAFIHRFEISKSLVTNAEFLEFMADGGYLRPELWLDEGWQWVQNENINAPLYWHRIASEWKTYTLSGLKSIEPNAMLCHVSFYEASAYAEWRGMRLPTEQEWEVASQELSWGNRWEWTNSAYLPYPNYKKEEGAIGEYNGKFMINQMVLRGASRATAPGHSRCTYRNFFHPQMQWQFTGIRLAKR